ncbi:hypothetical protein [Undibacterium luofuense]|uniref:Uncharacterized protein n=1 Tax=Undibacterium luofuense TaxID=2828733 RepID=A0A941DML5_9BURK|nr:hypothetical protein [Undibacterium luofuense]MBR7783588.1 hypothetical protein [Undibacterium luofuense]
MSGTVSGVNQQQVQQLASQLKSASLNRNDADGDNDKTKIPQAQAVQQAERKLATVGNVGTQINTSA